MIKREAELSWLSHALNALQKSILAWLVRSLKVWSSNFDHLLTSKSNQLAAIKWKLIARVCPWIWGEVAVLSILINGVPDGTSLLFKRSAQTALMLWSIVFTWPWKCRKQAAGNLTVLLDTEFLGHIILTISTSFVVCAILRGVWLHSFSSLSILSQLLKRESLIAEKSGEGWWGSGKVWKTLMKEIERERCMSGRKLSDIKFKSYCTPSRFWMKGFRSGSGLTLGCSCTAVLGFVNDVRGTAFMGPSDGVWKTIWDWSIAMKILHNQLSSSW